MILEQILKKVTPSWEVISFCKIRTVPFTIGKQCWPLWHPQNVSFLLRRLWLRFLNCINLERSCGWNNFSVYIVFRKSQIGVAFYVVLRAEFTEGKYDLLVTSNFFSEFFWESTKYWVLPLKAPSDIDTEKTEDKNFLSLFANLSARMPLTISTKEHFDNQMGLLFLLWINQQMTQANRLKCTP